MSNLRSSRNLLFLFTGALLFIVAVLPTAHGQSTTATLSGTVTDERGAVILGASVTVENINTRLRRQATTNDEGAFTIPLLPPSTYLVRVEGQGFATAQIPSVVLNVNDQVALNIQLKVGQISGDTVNVNADPPLVENSPAVSTVVDRQFIENLPLNGRSFHALLELTPGVTLTKTNINEQGQFSVNGQRANANYFTVDGVSANIGVSPSTFLQQAGGGSLPALTAFGGTNNLVSVDALQEFRVQTSTYSAEYGRSPGGQVSIATRSGTNDFHGSVFEYFRNDALDANNWFANANRQPKPALRQNDFGGVFGGPLYLPRFGVGGPSFNSGKNRTFFFFSYEGLRLRQPQATTKAVPSLAIRQSAPPTTRSFLDAFPLPNGRDLGNGKAEFSASYSNPSTLDATSIRIDHTISKNTVIFGRFNYAPSANDQRGAATNPLNNITSARFKTVTLTGGATIILNSKLSTEIRTNWSKTKGVAFITLDNFGGAIPPADSILLPPFASRGSSTSVVQFIGGESPFYAVTPPGKANNNAQRQINLINNTTLVLGAHQLKFGVDYRRLYPTLDIQPFIFAIAFNDFAGAVSGQALIVTVQHSFERPLFPIFNNFSAYAQDSWKVTPRLTLNYGLRWEVNPPPQEKNGNDAATVVGDFNNPSTLQLAPIGTPLYKTTYNNFAPRFGFAYDLTGKGETIIRGGAGIFYDLGTGGASDGWSRAPYSRFVARPGSSIPINPALFQPPPLDLSLPFSAITVYVPNYKLPYTIQWNLSVDRQLGANQVITASYVGAQGRRLARAERIRNPNPNFTQVLLTTNGAESSYNAMQLEFKRRLSRGLQALASYTWSHSIDTASDDTTLNTPSLRFNPELDRGNSTFDIRHAFTTAITYEIPLGRSKGFANALLRSWAIDGVFRARSASPINITTGRDVLGLGITNVARPDLISGVPVYIDDPTAPGGRRLNPAAFSTPIGRQGTLGRNALRGFPLNQLDLALRRQFNLTERVKLQLRAEMFNVLNHPNFGDPITLLVDPLFGRSTQMFGGSIGSGGASGGFNPLYQVGGPRSSQLSLKLLF
jgi:hypothetical protein